MFDPMLLADGRSGLNRRKGSKDSLRPRRRRANRRSQVAAEVMWLEERCLMSVDVSDPRVPER